MTLDCLLIGSNHGAYRLTQRSHWMNEEGRKLVDDPVDYDYSTMSMEYINRGGQWYEVFDLVNSLHADDPTWYLRHPRAGVPNSACIALAAYLRRHGWNTKWVNTFDLHQRTLGRMLDREDPLITCITTTFVTHPGQIIDQVHFIRERNPETSIVVGGPYIWNAYRKMKPGHFLSVLQFIGADYYVVDPEGEATLRRLLEALKNGRPVDDVPNLYWPYSRNKDAGNTAMVTENNPLEDWITDWHLFDREELGSVVFMRTALSCAYKCAFCDFPGKMGKLRVQPVDRVEEELRQLEKLGVRHINFVDDTFNVPVSRFEQILEVMLKNEFDMQWVSYLRVSNIKGKDAIRLAAESGCKSVFLGIESTDREVLKNMSKGTSMRRYREGIEELHRQGITTTASFITGFPGETRDSVIGNIDFINEMRPTFFHTLPWYYIPGTPVEKNANKFQLNGFGNHWTHYSMNSHAAHVANEALRDAVGESIWIPDLGYAMWSMLYLNASGFSWEDIIRFSSSIRDLTFSNPAGAGQPEVHNKFSTTAEQFLKSCGKRNQRIHFARSDRAQLFEDLKERITHLAPTNTPVTDSETEGNWMQNADQHVRRVERKSKFVRYLVPGYWKGDAGSPEVSGLAKVIYNRAWSAADSILDIPRAKTTVKEKSNWFWDNVR